MMILFLFRLRNVALLALLGVALTSCDSDAIQEAVISPTQIGSVPISLPTVTAESMQSKISADNGDGTTDFISWLGRYTFHEEDYWLDVTYTIEVYECGQQTYAEISIEGTDSEQRVNLATTASVFGNNDSIDLVSTANSSETVEWEGFHRFHEGEVLLSFEKTDFGLYTRWRAIDAIHPNNRCFGPLFTKDHTILDNPEEKPMDNWISVYHYDEVVDHYTRAYCISIYRKSGDYFAYVEIMGWQTSQTMRARIDGTENKIALIVDEYLSDGTSVPHWFEKDDVLWEFSLDDTGDLITYWVKIEPMLEENVGIQNAFQQQKPFNYQVE